MSTTGHPAVFMVTILLAEVAQPSASYTSEAPLLLTVLPESTPVPKIYALFSKVLSQARIKQSLATTTRKRTTELSAPFTEFSICPPIAEVAPVPTLILTTRFAASYSA